MASTPSGPPQQPYPPPPYGAPPPYQQPYPQPPAPRRANPWKWLVLGCGGLMALAICGVIALSVGIFGGKGSSPAVSGGGSTANTESVASVGQTATKGNWAITLDKVERTDRVGSSTTPPQGRYVIVYLTLKNVGKQSYSLNDWDFQVVNQATKNAYKPVTVAPGETLSGDYKVAVLGQTVQPDLVSKNAVVFDVPPDATDLVLEVQGIRFKLPPQ